MQTISKSLLVVALLVVVVVVVERWSPCFCGARASLSKFSIKYLSENKTEPRVVAGVCVHVCSPAKPRTHGIEC